MGKKPRARMSRGQRAKQFLPFAALDGLEEKLARAEQEKEPAVSLSPESVEHLGEMLRPLQPGDMVTVLYMKKDRQRQKTGTVGKVDALHRTLQLVDEVIPFYALLRIDPV